MEGINVQGLDFDASPPHTCRPQFKMNRGCCVRPQVEDEKKKATVVVPPKKEVRPPGSPFPPPRGPALTLPPALATCQTSDAGLLKPSRCTQW